MILSVSAFHLASEPGSPRIRTSFEALLDNWRAEKVFLRYVLHKFFGHSSIVPQNGLSMTRPDHPAGDYTLLKTNSFGLMACIRTMALLEHDRRWQAPSPVS